MNDSDRRATVKKKISQMRDGYFPVKCGLRISTSEYEEICEVLDYLLSIEESVNETRRIIEYKKYWGLAVHELG